MKYGDYVGIIGDYRLYVLEPRKHDIHILAVMDRSRRRQAPFTSGCGQRFVVPHPPDNKPIVLRNSFVFPYMTVTVTGNQCETVWL